MKLPLLLVLDFGLAVFTLINRFLNYPYLLSKASNGFVIDQRGVIKITKRVLVSYLIVFIVFSGTGIFYLFNPFGTSNADAAWFNDNWAYRKAITLTIDSQSAARTNVYALLTINTNLTSTKLQSACQDLRFTDINGSIIPYYIINTSSCNTNATNQIWIKIPSVPASTTSQIIYMYYGNPAATAGSNITQLPLIDGLQGYWKLNESSGTAADNSVNSNTLTNNNTTTYTTGQFANAASFASASSQSLSITDASQTGLDNMSALTLAFWVNPTTLVDNSRIIGKDSTNGNCSYNLAYDFNGALAFESCSNGFYGTGISGSTASSFISTSTWTHVVITSANGIVNIYKNGSLQTSGNFPISGTSSTVSNSSSAFGLGGFSSNGSASYMNGKLDDVRVYNRALSTNEIYSLYNNPGEAYLSASSTEQTPSAASEVLGPSPTLYWEFDQGQGTTAEDATSNGLDGTLNNTPTWQTEDQCVAGKCLYFDGTNNENVSVADNDKLDFQAADNFTVGAWVKRNGASSANTVIMQKTGANIGSTYTGYKLYMDASGDFCFDVQDGTNAVDSACTSAVDFDDDSWHFVQGVKAATTSVTLYVDGKQRAQDTSIASTGTLANASTFRVGIDSDGTSNDWLGFIDEVKVTRDQTARTVAQVQADYNTRGDREGTSQQQGNNIQNLPATLSNGLVGYWKMDETAWTNDCSTTSVTDSSGNGKNGKSCTSGGGVTAPSAGKFGNAPNFSGTNQFVKVNTPSLPTTDFTYSTWIYPDNVSGAKYIFYAQDGSFNDMFAIHLLTDDIVVTVNNATVITYASIIPATTWSYITVTRKGPDIKLFLNGIQYSATGTDGTALNFGSCPLLLGASNTSSSCDSSSGNFFDGKIDEARVYNRALTSSEISQLYNWAPGPVGYWKMDDPATIASAATATDSSGQGNNLTTNRNSGNYPLTVAGKYGGALDPSQTVTDHNRWAAIADGPAALDQTGPITIEAWVKTNTVSSCDSAAMVSKGLSASTFSSSTQLGFRFTLDCNSGGGSVLRGPKLTVSSNGTSGGETSTTTQTTTTLSANTWNHMTGVYTGSQLIVYLNGNQYTAPVSYSSGIFNNTGNFTVGGLQYSGGGSLVNDFPGAIDDVRLYNYARTQGQIIEDMNAGHPAPGSPVGTPVGFWKLDEGYGTTANNSGSAGSLLPGTLTNMDSPATSTSGWANDGKFNKALSFNGSSSSGDYVNIPYNTALNVTTDITLTAWIKKAADADYGGIIAKTDGSTLWDYDFFICDSGCTAGNDYLGFYSNATTPDEIFSNRTITGTDWHHVAITRSGSTVTFYIDGQASGGGTMSGSFASNSLDLKIGTDGTGSGVSQFNGKIDEPKLYNEALTADQIKLDYNKSSTQILGAMGNNSTAGAVNAASQEYCIPGDSTTCTGPVARWDFEEGVASGGTNYDTSGNANNCSTDGTIAVGKIGKARNYNESVRVSCGTGATLNDLSALTTEAWIYPRDMGQFSVGTVITKNDSPGAGGWAFGFDNGTTNGFRFYADFTGTDLDVKTANNMITLNRWNYVAVSWDGGTAVSGVHIYVNGKEVTYGTTTAGVGSRVTDATNTLYIGETAGQNNGFDGIIDQSRVFNYVRTQPQIAYDMNRGAPLAYWKFDECQGTTINDSAGNSLTGTWSGSGGSNTSAGDCTTAGTAWGDGVTGKRNYSMEFDGSDDTVNFGSPNLLNLTDSIGISMWVKPDSNALSSGEHAMIHNYDGGGTTGQYEVAFINGALEFNYGAASSYVSYNPTPSISFTAGNWYHIVFTHSGSNSTGYFYINGVKYSTNRSGSATIPTGGYGNTVVGATTYSGQLDDIKMFNYTLTESQAKLIYNDGATRYGPTTGAP